MEHLSDMRGFLGIVALLLLAWVLSEDRFRVPWRVVMAGVLLQFALALLFLHFPPAASASFPTAATSPGCVATVRASRSSSASR